MVCLTYLNHHDGQIFRCEKVENLKWTTCRSHVSIVHAKFYQYNYAQELHVHVCVYVKSKYATAVY